MAEEEKRQYIYIVQASQDKTRCKIGKTSDLDGRLKTYNNMTGKSVDKNRIVKKWKRKKKTPF